MSQPTKSRHDLILAEGIEFSYASRKILHGIDFSAHSGEMIGILGPNGAGKSTLLGVLTGDLTASAGRVTLGGTPIAEYSRKDLARARSVMPQTSEFPFSYLVRDVVAMARSANPTDQDEQIVNDAMTRTDVVHLQDRQITALSGGECARVTLARVIAQRAEVIFLDEPTAALDIAHQAQTMQICRDLTADGACVVAVMHDIQLAAAYCDRIAIMKDGEIQALGTPTEVVTSERLSDVYGWPITVARVDGRTAVIPS
ncbi:MAG: heme ABC transporter ATP-binding protein [Arcanobacterium sp.]|nr:heme ABC transporter ATP-binding protein [Arcanobacterium sp.]